MSLSNMISDMEDVYRDEFSEFIRENLIKLDLDDRAFCSDPQLNNLACMQYVNPEGIVIAQVTYHKGNVRRYQIRKGYRKCLD